MKLVAEESTLEMTDLDGQTYIKMSGYDALRPFFMSIVSNSDHWLFVSSNGGITAGRKNADSALFPYQTDDKVTESVSNTGSRTIFRIKNKDHITLVWEPFSVCDCKEFEIKRNLYKSIYGNSVIFEEQNHTLGLVFHYKWQSSQKYGFVKSSHLKNTGTEEVICDLLDGIQNLVPYGVDSNLQNALSNLTDAYKRNEIDADSGMGVFALSAIIVDKAEPSEALKATVAWSAGLKDCSHLLSSAQVSRYRHNQQIQAEYDVKGEKGAYFVSSQISIQPGESREWLIIADVNKSYGQLAALRKEIIEHKNIIEAIKDDINLGTQELKTLVAAADGFSFTADERRDVRHFSNVLFNIMRGGVIDNNYTLDKSDLHEYYVGANNTLTKTWDCFLDGYSGQISYKDLIINAIESNNPDLIRLTFEYLPLKFSRRHGDPSRPWNKFNIHLSDENTQSKVLNYEGNWRDIFQNWEALAYSYPFYLEGMIFKFLDASTFEGYNPYRIFKKGIDWEVIEPDDPWSYVGYWGDHQIIYLLRLLELLHKTNPVSLLETLDKNWFVYADIPYIIKPYDEIIHDAKNTILFDHKRDHELRARIKHMGADGVILQAKSGQMHHVTFLEKILATLLSKMSNFIPDGGIWMNTQRPEWNDANNALVGNGVSMVTLYYIHRFILFFDDILAESNLSETELSTELAEYYKHIKTVYADNMSLLEKELTPADRKQFTDRLGRASSDYRSKIYAEGFSGSKINIDISDIRMFIGMLRKFVKKSITGNQRKDHLYHAYNLMTYTAQGITVEHLDEMLEGQVAVLNSGVLDSKEVFSLLDALRNSKLYREDQQSYILYPNKSLPGFFSKNVIPKAYGDSSALIQKLVHTGNTAIIEKDVDGNYHFNGRLRNAGELKLALEKIRMADFADFEVEKKSLLDVYEQVFKHKAFTGRSGTFFAYEGLGSIYWHMVSKLLLVVQENLISFLADEKNSSVCEKIKEHYKQIYEGIGVHKTPKEYGAFPTDPYSHTPIHKGVQQPGMTGQVKEDILTHWGHMGVLLNDGCIMFCPYLLTKELFLSSDRETEIYSLNGNTNKYKLNKGQLLFTYCQVPIIYEIAGKSLIEIHFNDGKIGQVHSEMLDRETSLDIFGRKGNIRHIKVFLDNNIMDKT